MVTKKAPWQPLDLSTLPPCQVIACDPSLAGLGIVHIEVKDGEVAVLGAEKLATVQTDRKGWDDTFYRAGLLEALIAALIDAWLEVRIFEDVYAVHESPPIGKNMMRTESTILAGYGFRSVMNEYEIPIDKTVTAQSHKKLICGNHVASKTEHHTAIKELLPKIVNSEMITNEATRDALSIALYAAWREANG